MILDRVAPSDAAKVIGHEIIGHHGLRAVFGKDFDTFLDGVWRDHSEDIMKLSKDYNESGKTPESQRSLTEEFLANGADADQKPSWWKEFLGSIRKLLRRLFPKLRFTDTDIEAALSRSARAVRRRSAPVNGMDGDVRFAMTPENRAYYQIPFADGLKRAVDPAAKDMREPVFVSETPKVFRDIGFTALPMMMNVRHLRLNYYTEQEFKNAFGNLRGDEHAHGLHTYLNGLPNALKYPLAVVVNKTPNAKPGSVVAITNMDVAGKKVVVPILIEATSNADGNRIDSHLVLTVYDSSDWRENFLRPALEAEKNGIGVFYFDPKKTGQYGAYSNRIGRIPSGYVHNINDEGSPVKGNFKKQTETLQFKRWFGDSKVVDEDGNPLVVYRRDNEKNFSDTKKTVEKCHKNRNDRQCDQSNL